MNGKKNGRKNNGKKRIDSDIERLIGQRVKQLRLQLGISQEQLAKEVGLSFQQIQKYEKGTNRLSVSRMLEFVRILKTTPHDLIGWKVSNPPINDFNMDVFAAARDFSLMPESMQIAVRRICDAIMDALKKTR